MSRVVGERREWEAGDHSEASAHVKGGPHDAVELQDAARVADVLQGVRTGCL